MINLDNILPDTTAEILKNSGFTDVEITLDLNGMKRIVSGQKKC